MTTSILITGASGLIGKRLTDLLLQKGYRVSHLGRARKAGAIPSFVWNIETGEMDPQSLNDVDVIIHLAGAGVAEKRWTSARKQEILSSRTKSSALLCSTLKNSRHQVKTVISASAIGIYGFEIDDGNFLSEESSPGNNYLAKVVLDWEKEVDQIALLGIRVVKIRIGIVLSDQGGALKEMANPIKYGVGAPLASGRQIISWIHLEDLCSIFMLVVQDEKLQGAYNAVGPQPVTNEEMTVAIAKVLGRPLWLPNIPAFILRLILGEMAEVVIHGSRVSSQKIQEKGFSFQFSALEPALRNLFHRRNGERNS